MNGSLEHLGTDECWRLLTQYHLGRVAMVLEGRPFVMPVNYIVSGVSVLYRAGAGSSLDPAEAGSLVALEVDMTKPEYHSGWSVVLQGHARQVTDSAELADCARLPLRPWVTHAQSVCVRITGEVTGRRIGFR